MHTNEYIEYLNSPNRNLSLEEKEELLIDKIEMNQNIEKEIYYVIKKERYKATLYNEFEFYDNLYALREEAYKLNKELVSISNKRKIYKDNDKLTTELLASIITYKIINNASLSIMVNTLKVKHNLDIDKEYLSYLISEYALNFKVLYKAIEKEVMSSNKISKMDINYLEAISDDEEDEEYGRYVEYSKDYIGYALSNADEANNNKCIFYFVSDYGDSDLVDLLKTYNKDYYNFKFDSCNYPRSIEYYNFIFTWMYSDSLVSNILYSIINSALLNTLNAKAYLTYLFNEFKDKEMGDPSKYLPWSKEMIEKFKMRNSKEKQCY